jgi:hypothetical protein
VTGASLFDSSHGKHPDGIHTELGEFVFFGRSHYFPPSFAGLTLPSFPGEAASPRSKVSPTGRSTYGTIQQHLEVFELKKPGQITQVPESVCQ